MWMRDEMPGRRANGPLVSDMGFDSKLECPDFAGCKRTKEGNGSLEVPKAIEAACRARANDGREGKKLEGVDGVGGKCVVQAGLGSVLNKTSLREAAL